MRLATPPPLLVLAFVVGLLAVPSRGGARDALADFARSPQQRGAGADAVRKRNGPTARTEGGCFCTNDRFGAACRHSIPRSNEFVPTSLPRPCARDTAAARAFQRTLERTQSCRAGGRLRVYAMPKYGFGSIFSYAVYGLASAAGAGAAFEEPNKSIPGFAPSSCENGGFACYLENFSGCAAGVRSGRLGKRPIPFLVSRRRKDWRQLLFGPSARRRGTFWFHSQLVQRLWQLRKAERAAADFVQRANFTWQPANSCVGVHVRHGDACKDHRSQRRCYSAATYIRHARRLKSRYKLKGVFLATDDPSVVRAFRAQRDLNVAVQGVDRGWLSGGGSTRIETRMKSRSATGGVQGRIGRETVVDMELLARCSAFVGTFSTNLGRLAYEIMAARQNTLPPYVSLDIAWCPGFARDNGYVYAQGKQIKFDC